MSDVIITTGVNEKEQRSNFSNATLQGVIGDELVVSIATYVGVPFSVARKGELAVADWIRGVLGHKMTSYESYEVQIGKGEVPSSP